MPDQLSPASRSALMRRVRTHDTEPELRLRRAMWARGLRGWRVNVRSVAGCPDIAWLGARVAVFVDGAFWHGHPDYYHGQSGPFWDEKIARNRARDERVNSELEDEGWKVVRIWDFEVKKSIDECIDQIEAALGSGDTAAHG